MKLGKILHGLVVSDKYNKNVVCIVLVYLFKSRKGKKSRDALRKSFSYVIFPIPFRERIIGISANLYQMLSGFLRNDNQTA